MMDNYEHVDDVPSKSKVLLAGLLDGLLKCQVYWGHVHQGVNGVLTSKMNITLCHRIPKVLTDVAGRTSGQFLPVDTPSDILLV